MKYLLLTILILGIAGAALMLALAFKSAAKINKLICPHCGSENDVPQKVSAYICYHCKKTVKKNRHN